MLRKIIILISILGFCLPTLSLGQTDKKLSADEVKKLFTNKTITATIIRKDFAISRYYAPNGKFYGIRNDKIQQGEWSVQDGGEMCLTIAKGKTACRDIRTTDEKYYKVRVKGNGKMIHILEYHTFTDGNTKNYKWTDKK